LVRQNDTSPVGEDFYGGRVDEQVEVNRPVRKRQPRDVATGKMRTEGNGA
jgi:hypothetical protein